MQLQTSRINTYSSFKIENIMRTCHLSTGEVHFSATFIYITYQHITLLLFTEDQPGNCNEHLLDGPSLSETEPYINALKSVL